SSSREVASQVNRRPRISKAPRRVSEGFCAARSCFSFGRKAAELFSILLLISVSDGVGKMLVTGQRYQKSRNLSGLRSLPVSGILLVAFGGLTGCAGAEPPQAASTGQPQLVAQAAVMPAAQLAPDAAPAVASSGRTALTPAVPR